jgi:hypothetical protein
VHPFSFFLEKLKSLAISASANNRKLGNLEKAGT